MARLSTMSLIVTAFSRPGADAGGISEGIASVSLASGASAASSALGPVPLIIVAECGGGGGGGGAVVVGLGKLW